MNGRKPNQTPATAYDYRRAIALVQVLAADTAKARLQGIVALSKAWGLYDADIRWTELVARMARHALEQARNESEDA